MSIGFKQRGSDGPLYHPERDFAYITPTLMKQAIDNMTAPPSVEIEKWKQENNITEAEIVAAAEALADAQRDFVNAADPVSSLAQALQRYGYFDLRLPVRLLLESMVGEVMLGAWFKAVREVTVVGEESPAQDDMCRFSAAVRAFVERLGALHIDGNITAEVVRMRADVMHGKLASCMAERATAKAAQLDAEMHAARLEVELNTLPRWLRRLGRWLGGKTEHSSPK